MKTLNYAVLFVVAILVVSFGCADDGPTAPSTTVDTPVSTPVNAPPAAVRATPASFDATSSLRHDINEGFNAYDFTASYDGGMLTLVLTEDEMRSMREASKPHRNRMITVGICPSEPRRISQACGDPIWQDSMRLAGSLELPAIPLAACDGWIVVNAAEMFDDRYDGWRNAPCPRPDGEPAGSDGTGPGWPNYNEYECGKDGSVGDPRRNEMCGEPEREPEPEAPLPVTIEGSWLERVGPINACIAGGTIQRYCLDGTPSIVAQLLDSGIPPVDSTWGRTGQPANTDEATARRMAVAAYNAAPLTGWGSETERMATATSLARAWAEYYCEDAGGMLPILSLEIFPAVNPTTLAGAVDGWEYTDNRQTGNQFQYQARPVYQWRATCARAAGG